MMENGSNAVAEAGGDDDDATKSAARLVVETPRVPATVGEQLKAARETQGLSLKDIAASTRITSRHVQAIEDGDYNLLPGRPYALGFARSYARAVGLDEKPIADLVRQELQARVPRAEPRVIHQFEVGDPAKTPSRLVNWLALMLFVAIIGMGLVFWRSTYWPAAELPSLLAAERAAPTPKPAIVVAKPASPSGPVVFTALEDGVWVKFYDGAGKQLMQKQLAKGESYTVPADAAEPKLWTGRPDALAITVGGQPVRRIAEKEGIVKDIGVSAAALVARTTVPDLAPTAAAPRPAPSTAAF